VFYLSAFQYVTKILPENLLATGHVFFLTVIFGVGGLLGSLAGGMIIEQLGMANLYLCMGIVAAIGTTSFIVYRLAVVKEKGVIRNNIEWKG
jgi:predicted MFS family arabinose efflux permease